jgi:HAD superfamily hydrolase (TIGR01509 family)
MPIRAIFFDIDGTLVDSNGYHAEAWQRAFAATGRSIDRARIASQIGKGTDNLVPALLPGTNEAEAERLGGLHGQFFKGDYMPRVRAFPGARDLLARVRDSGRQVVLASSASGEELDHYVGIFDAKALVDTSTTIDDVERSKPAPDIFAVAAKKVGLDPAEVVVVGDAPYDMEAARKLGIGRVAVRSGGFDDRTLVEAGAQAIYDDVADLLARFEGSPLDR